jgi:hypothetical protein
MLSPLRLALAASALLWIIGVAAPALYPPAAALAGAALTASILLAVGAVIVLVRRLDARTAALEARVAAMRNTLQKARALPSSEDDWSPRPAADAETIAGILAVAGRADIGAVMRVGAADHPALADTIATIDRTSPHHIVVVDAPAEAFAISVVSARGSGRTVTAIVSDARAADAIRQEVRAETASVLEVVQLPHDRIGEGGGWSTELLATVQLSGLVYLGGPPWSLGPEARHALVDRICTGSPAVTAVIVPEPRRFESQAAVDRLRAGGFHLARETASTAYLERIPSPA